MVYESGFTSRRTYSSRPIVTSYAVSIYKASYPIYSTSSYTPGYRSISSPVRIITSPARAITRVIASPSPVRVNRTTTTRVIISPERLTPHNYTTPTPYTSYYIPSTNYSSYIPYAPYYVSRYILSHTPSKYVYSSPYLYSSPVTRVYSRSLTPARVISTAVCGTPLHLKRISPGYNVRALKSYLGTEPFATFREETGRIRNRAQSLMRDLHTPLVRPVRSMTPFPVTSFDPSTDVAFDAYVSRITNPVRHIAKEVHKMSMYPEPAHKYVGKSHLASVRICGDRAYNIRRSMYDADRVLTDINLLSWYLRHRTVNEGKKSEEEVESVDNDSNLDPIRPTRKFSVLRPLESPVDDETREKQHFRQERLMASNEEILVLGELQNKSMQHADETKQREQRAFDEEQELKTAEVRKRLEEEAKLTEEPRLVDEARLTQKDRVAEANRLAEETARKPVNTARLAEEQRIREEELRRLAEIEKQAEEEREADLARQAAELAEIARQETEIAAQALYNIQQTDEIEITADTKEYLTDKPLGFEVQQKQDSTIDVNIRSGDTEIAYTSTEEGIEGE